RAGVHAVLRADRRGRRAAQLHRRGRARQRCRGSPGRAAAARRVAEGRAMNTARDADDACAIRAHGLSKRFGRLQAVNHVDLDVPARHVYGFLGPNGSGKSTTIRMLCGLLTPSQGDIEVLGLEIPRQADALRSKVGYMTQRFSLFEDLSVRENLEFLSAIHDFPRQRARVRVDELIREYDFADRQKQLAGTMSGGQKQRLALAGAVINKPELLFLDEPTSAVDPESRRDFWEKLFELADLGTTILVSTHLMDEAERCHRLAILDHGHLVADGTPAQLTGQLQGRTLVVATPEPRRAQRALLDVAGVLSVAQVGNDLRVLVESNEDEARKRIHSALAHIGL